MSRSFSVRHFLHFGIKVLHFFLFALIVYYTFPIVTSISYTHFNKSLIRVSKACIFLALVKLHNLRLRFADGVRVSQAPQTRRFRPFCSVAY